MNLDAPRAVLFDLDGVLVDSYELWYRLLSQTARELGYPEISHDAYRECWGQSTRADRDRFFPGHSLQAVETFYQEHYFEHVDRLFVFEEVPEVFRRLRERGIASAVVTNTQKSLASVLVGRAGATPDVVVGGGDAPRGKPAPDLLLLACELLDVASARAWMVGDSVYDQAAARSARISFVGVGLDGDVRIDRVGDLLGLMDEP